MTDTGDTLEVASTTPIRTCAGCRAKSAQSHMLRFAREADGQVVPANVTRDLRGRTTYLCPRRACLDQAVKRRAFARAFGTDRNRVSVLEVDASALWTATAEQLRRELELLARTSATPHTHHRRRGLERLLSELSSQPQTPERRASTRGGAPNHG
jgi:predicted RNA-binding protein YlxR (DUF448 family)